MDRKLKLPIGIDNFEKIRKENFYYVDKTKLIEQLLERWGEVNLSVSYTHLTLPTKLEV